MNERKKQVQLFHNIRWSRYKARVFSALHSAVQRDELLFDFVQIADTNGHRAGLSGVDLGYHQYPHELLFEGAYNAVPKQLMARTLFRKVVDSDADLVLIPGYEKPEYWAMLLAAIVRGKKRAVFCDSTLYDRPQSVVKGLLKRVFFARCDGIFCYGERAREFLLHYGVPHRKIFQRYQAAALPDGYSAAEARSARLRLAPPSSEPRFLYVGRLSPEKSLDVLLHAFRSVLDAKPGARLVVVGAGSDGARLAGLASELGLGGVVEFAGSMGQEALAAQYARASCLVLPSRTEPWGLVVNEALHYACPVVVSDHCGCVPELVRDGITGFAFRSGDPGDLAAKLLRVADEFGDPAQVADRCLEVIGQYTPDVAARQIIEGCRTILGEGRSAP
jgi:Glycosyltransferase